MDIATDKVCDLIVRARTIDGKDGETDPDSGSNPIDDGSTDVLTSARGDSTEDQVREFIAGLNDDERHDLVAIAWIGRGDFEASDWAEALRTARERETLSTADYLLGIPNLGDLLDEGLAALGRRCD
ncbi:DUF3775 domain-containing protein [Enterovirga rhinocerotis]|uniref:Uncharacterized protein DUF3775 n=1 Tax=Enterovirga rhinocerotis TaxID=1339210 RepID=A0A4R7CDB8_9HYPH|nr:DUF3775 domain-containing protein [Enterovirga rhinocerotis]TDR94827.1 uncharacterized protein DUF3775 [Enterovirga rhinocerotis]